jgi:Flp pilus assembly protein TadD
MPIMITIVRYRLAIVASLGLLLAACVSAPPPPPAKVVDSTTPQQRLAAIDSVAGSDDTELQVQPLRDAQVEDLRVLAATQRAAGDLNAAAATLDQALQQVAGDPGILQERAEIALLLSDYPGAERYARQALDLGSQTGPLCRRHWATIEQSRLARVQQVNAASAHAQIEACTVPGIKRY